MKIIIDKVKGSYMVRNEEYTFSFWCNKYTVDGRSCETKYVALWNDNTYVGTIMCSEVVERFYREEK